MRLLGTDDVDPQAWIRHRLAQVAPQRHPRVRRHPAVLREQVLDERSHRRLHVHLALDQYAGLRRGHVLDQALRELLVTLSLRRDRDPQQLRIVEQADRNNLAAPAPRPGRGRRRLVPNRQNHPRSPGCSCTGPSSYCHSRSARTTSPNPSIPRVPNTIAIPRSHTTPPTPRSDFPATLSTDQPETPAKSGWPVPKVVVHRFVLWRARGMVGRQGGGMDRLDAVAREQLLVLARTPRRRQELRDLGLGRPDLRRLVRRGHLRHHHGHYMDGHIDDQVAVIACARAAYPGSIISHFSAARLAGLSLWIDRGRSSAPPIEATWLTRPPTARRNQRRPDIVVRRAGVTAVDVSRHVWLPVTGIARTVVDSPGSCPSAKRSSRSTTPCGRVRRPAMSWCCCRPAATLARNPASAVCDRLRRPGIGVRTGVHCAGAVR